MRYHFDEEIIYLVRAFEERTLTKEEWDHAAQLTVGLYYCMKYTLPVARNVMKDGIYWLNQAHGTPNDSAAGYHETLTFYWLEVTHSYLRYTKHTKITDLANDLIMTLWNPGLPLESYSPDRLLSPEAKARYVVPDLTWFGKEYARAA